MCFSLSDCKKYSEKIFGPLIILMMGKMGWSKPYTDIIWLIWYLGQKFWKNCFKRYKVEEGNLAENLEDSVHTND